MPSKTAILAAYLIRLIPLWACGLSLAQVGLTPLLPPGEPWSQLAPGENGFFAHQAVQSIKERQQYWHRDFSSAEAYERSVHPNRERLRALIGAMDARLPVGALEVLENSASPAKIAETDSFTVQAVRWPVLEGVFAEGLWLQPTVEPVARIVALPDADQTPEMLVGLAPGLAAERQFARRLAENGCEVLVPVLIDRQDMLAWECRMGRLIRQTHREWICRQASPTGRHVIGYELQKVLAAVDFLEGRSPKTEGAKAKIAVAGYAEGGLVAFYAAALDQRIEAVLVSGCFNSQPRLEQEPNYRQVPGLGREFGDAEVASLIAPRVLIVEHSVGPNAASKPGPREGVMGTFHGTLTTPDYDSVEAEFERARALMKAGKAKEFDRLKLMTAAEGMPTGPGSDRSLAALLEALGVPVRKLKRPGEAPADSRAGFEPDARQQRQVRELENYTQRLLRE